MKQLSCKQLGGACDQMITGNTPEEMAEDSKKHAMKMFAANDEAHINAMEKMRSMTPEEFAVFQTNFVKMFEGADNIEE